MAATITHFVLADKVFDQFFSHLEKDEFFVGNIFPDIRYIGTIDREKTHSDDVSLKKIIKEDSFSAGRKFHQLTDKVEAKYAKEKGVFSLFPHLDYAIQSLKLFSDEVLYPKVNNWQKYASFFDKILSEEEKFGIKKEDILKWHQMTQQYICQKPNPESREKLIKQTIMGSGSVSMVNQNIEEIRRGGRVEKIILEFYDSFGALIKEYEKDYKI